MPSSSLLSTLQIKGPLILAPMAGGLSTPALVAAVTKAGALGSLGAAYMNGSEIRGFADALERKGVKRFAVNLFIPQPEPKISQEQISLALGATAAYRRELNLPSPSFQGPYALAFDEQFEAMLSVRPCVFSFIFGPLPAHYRDDARRAGILLMGTATSLEEALLLEESGVDAIILQGHEAGGHRGIFDSKAEDSALTVKDLLAACRLKIKLPLIAAGGIMNGEDMHQALSLGAEAVQMGTAFLACDEAGTSLPYRRELAKVERISRCTRVFSGRLARGLENRFMKEMEESPKAVLPFPVQNAFTRDIRNAAAQKGLSAFLSLWAGTGKGEIWTGSARDLVKKIFDECEAAKKRESSESLLPHNPAQTLPY